MSRHRSQRLNRTAEPHADLGCFRRPVVHSDGSSHPPDISPRSARCRWVHRARSCESLPAKGAFRTSGVVEISSVDSAQRALIEEVLWSRHLALTVRRQNHQRQRYLPTSSEQGRSSFGLCTFGKPPAFAGNSEPELDERPRVWSRPAWTNVLRDHAPMVLRRTQISRAKFDRLGRINAGLTTSTLMDNGLRNHWPRRPPP